MNPQRCDGPIGYYVHHHGAGHVAHAVALARVLGDRLVGLGSGPPPDQWHGRWVELAHDARPAPEGDPTNAGAWHWVPRHHQGFTERMRTIARWIADEEPAALVSDVSVEVAVLAQLLGVASVPVLLHGDRCDRPHHLALDTAAAIIAPWPGDHREPWHAAWAEKLHPVGLMSRFDGRVAGPPPQPPGHVRRVLVLLPAGGHEITTAAIEQAARASSAAGWTWDVAGANAPVPTSSARWHGQVEDLWPLLQDASVVVAAAGAASVADIAAARRPAVLLPQRRPFGEQSAFVGHLEGVAPVRVRSSWPAPDAWPGLLEDAVGLDGTGWASLHDGRAAHRMAAVLASLAGERVAAAP